MITDKQRIEMAAHRQNIEYVRENVEIIRRAYSDRYIALVNKVIVDSDKDEATLASRACDKFHDKDLTLTSICDATNPPTFRIRTPFLVDGAIIR